MGTTDEFEDDDIAKQKKENKAKAENGTIEAATEHAGKQILEQTKGVGKKKKGNTKKKVTAIKKRRSEAPTATLVSTDAKKKKAETVTVKHENTTISTNIQESNQAEVEDKNMQAETN